MNFPNQPSGNSRETAWLKRLLEACIASRIVPGIGYKVRRTTKGSVLEVDFPGTGSRVSRYRFKSMGTDHLVCRTWDGTTEGTIDVNIAKSIKLRFSITTETVDGLAITYSAYSGSAQTRLATATGTSETQVIVPRFIVNDIIYAIPAPTGVTAGSPAVTLDLLDLNIDGRAWSAT